MAAALSNAKLTEAESQRVVAVAEADALRET